jgi:putative ABC transport system permease protein
VLSSTSGVLGVLLAKWALSALTHVTALDLPRIGEIRLDDSVLGLTVVLSVLTGILFGLFPSLEVSRPDVVDALRESGATAGRGPIAQRRVFGVSTRGLLVVGQIALSIVLLIGATLLMRSFIRLHNVDPGFRAANLLTMKIPLPPTRYDTSQKKLAFFNQLLRRAEAAPGVHSAAMAMSIPTTPWLWTNVQVEGQADEDPSKWPTSQLQSITPGYVRTLGLSLRRGREFTERDNSPGAPPVVIINERFARRFWPNYSRGEDPVGQHMREGADKTGLVEIVGVVADVHEGGLAMDPGPEFYVSAVMHPPQTAYLMVRTESAPLHFVNAIRRQVLAIDRDQPVSDVKAMDDVLEARLGQRRLTMLLLGTFAGVALLLAVIGIYGMVAYSVAQRTQEVGIRRALGAQHEDILRLVLSQGLGLTIAGIVIGIGGALALTQLMKGLLFGVSASDPTTFAGIGLLFIAVALVASFIPARRAAQIDPMAALRVG